MQAEDPYVMQPNLELLAQLQNNQFAQQQKLAKHPMLNGMNGINPAALNQLLKTQDPAMSAAQGLGQFQAAQRMVNMAPNAQPLQLNPNALDANQRAALMQAHAQAQAQARARVAAQQQQLLALQGNPYAQNNPMAAAAAAAALAATQQVAQAQAQAQAQARAIQQVQQARAVQAYNFARMQQQQQQQQNAMMQGPRPNLQGVPPAALANAQLLLDMQRAAAMQGVDASAMNQALAQQLQAQAAAVQAAQAAAQKQAQVQALNQLKAALARNQALKAAQAAQAAQAVQAAQNAQQTAALYKQLQLQQDAKMLLAQQSQQAAHMNGGRMPQPGGMDMHMQNGRAQPPQGFPPGLSPAHMQSLAVLQRGGGFDAAFALAQSQGGLDVTNAGLNVNVGKPANGQEMLHVPKLSGSPSGDVSPPSPGTPPGAAVNKEQRRLALACVALQLARGGISVEQAINSGIMGGMSVTDVRFIVECYDAERLRMDRADGGEGMPPPGEGQMSGDGHLGPPTPVPSDSDNTEQPHPALLHQSRSPSNNSEGQHDGVKGGDADQQFAPVEPNSFDAFSYGFFGAPAPGAPDAGGLLESLEPEEEEKDHGALGLGFDGNPWLQPTDNGLWGLEDKEGEDIVNVNKDDLDARLANLDLGSGFV